MKEDRPFIIATAIGIGILLGNFGWVVPSAIARGGTDNVFACIALPLVALMLFIFIWLGPRWPE